MEWQGAMIMAKIQNASASVKNAQVTIDSVFGKFPKIDTGNLKVVDRATFSFIAGQLAVNDKTAVKLALNESGKEAVSIQSLTRAFYSIYNFYQKKLKIELIKCVGAEADSFYTVLISKTKEEFALPTRKAEAQEIKLEASSKRAKNDTQAFKKAEALITVEASKEYIARISAIMRKKIPDIEASIIDTIARDIYNYSRTFKF